MTDIAWLDIIIQGASFLILFIVIFLIAKFLKDWFTPYNIDTEITQHDNPAMAISLAGYYLGVFAVFIGALLGPSTTLVEDLITVGGYSLLGILLLNLSRYINDKLILFQFSTKKEIIEDHNSGTGIVVFGSYLASGLVVAGAIHGEGGGIITALVFYILGQVALVLFSLLYEWITPYSIHDEIEADNVAAGLGFGGGLVAIGIIVMRAVSGDFVSWGVNLTGLLTNVIIVFVYLILVRLFFDKVVIAKADLNHEIQKDKNIGAGMLEFAIAIGFSTVLFFLL